MRALIISLGDISVPLLASSVPDLKFKPMIFYIDSFYLEVDSDSGDVVLFKLITAESH